MRSRKLLNLAHECHACTYRSPNCIGYSIEGLEPAHSDFHEHGKGIGKKAKDDRHAAVCHPCHLYIGENIGDRELRLNKMTQAINETMAMYESEGLLKKVGYGKWQALE